MNISLKNVKIAEFASHETVCFEASVYVNGKRAFIATNDGQGGCNFYHPVNEKGKTLLKKAQAYAKTLPGYTFEAGGETHTIDSDLDDVVFKLLDDWKHQQRMNRLCKSHVVVTFDDDAESFTQFNVEPTRANIERVKTYLSQKEPGRKYEIVNLLA